MAPKHSLSADTLSTQKKRKLTPKAILYEDIVKKADAVLAIIPIMKSHSGIKDTNHLQTVERWEYVCSLAKVVEAPWTKIAIDNLDERLPDDNRNFQMLQKLNLFWLPAPSEFAKKWSQYENKFKDHILCFRPPNSRGLPLCTLHDVFRIAVQKPISGSSETAISAMRSASELCSSMGQSFPSGDVDSSVMQDTTDDKENARVVAFDDCMHGVLESFKGAVLVLDVPVVLREMKGEPGAGGDPYMQIVRSYDLSVKVLQEKEHLAAQRFLKEGAPMFLLCVSGPELLVAGGFWDGETVTVEPLGDPCIMFNDTGRVEKLARVLYALANGISQLTEYFLL